jgi:hypothetical protein
MSGRRLTDRQTAEVLEAMFGPQEKGPKSVRDERSGESEGL